jgi:hypothetical protein
MTPKRTTHNHARSKKLKNVTKDDKRCSSTQVKMTRKQELTRNADRKQNIKQALSRKKDDLETRVTDDANQIKTEDLKKRKLQASF